MKKRLFSAILVLMLLLSMAVSVSAATDAFVYDEAGLLTEGESAVKDYFAFLSSGGCQDPVSILQKAGVDLTTEQPFKAAMEEFENTLNELKSLF